MRTSTTDRRALPPAARQAVGRRITAPVRVLFALLVAVSITGVSIPTWLQYVPLVVSLVVFGLPHGALDHLVPARLAGQRPTWWSIITVVALYVLLGGATLVLWAVAPMMAFAFFILLTWFHWGQGDLWAMLALDGATHLTTRRARGAALLIRGALPMIVPLLTQGDTYRLVAAGATTVLSPTPATPLPHPTPGTAVTGAVVAGAALLLYAWSTHRTARRDPAALRDWRTDMLDTILLTVFFATVPAILAIGLYFCAWHAIRHIIRLAAIDPANRADVEAGRLLHPILRFGRDALPITAIALVLLAALAASSPSPADAPEHLLGVYLVLLSALTVPHVVIVTLMDARQGVWRTVTTSAATTDGGTADRQAHRP